jgi:hypothetical protein
VKNLLSFLLASRHALLVADDIKDWWPLWSRVSPRFSDPIEAAIAGGALADRLGFAFAAGYHAALRSLIPALAAEHLVALCATEDKGAHPRHIQSTLESDGEGYELSGHKRWSTLATEANELLVLAKVGTDAAGRNQLRLARVRADAPGVSIRPMPVTPFAPEIPHAEISFERVRVESAELLQGDAWERYVKPFRTIEDLHVHGSLLGYLVGVGCRCSWPESDVERLLALIVAVRALAQESPEPPEIHLALAGLLDQTARVVQELEPRWQTVGAHERERWQRDQGLLSVAGAARAARTKRAWQRLSGLEIEPARP